jgi:hypothetical protein
MGTRVTELALSAPRMRRPAPSIWHNPIIQQSYESKLNETYFTILGSHTYTHAGVFAITLTAIDVSTHSANRDGDGDGDHAGRDNRAVSSVAHRTCDGFPCSHLRSANSRTTHRKRHERTSPPSFPRAMGPRRVDRLCKSRSCKSPSSSPKQLVPPANPQARRPGRPRFGSGRYSTSWAHTRTPHLLISPSASP